MTSNKDWKWDCSLIVSDVSDIPLSRNKHITMYMNRPDSRIKDKEKEDCNCQIQFLFPQSINNEWQVIEKNTIVKCHIQFGKDNNNWDSPFDCTPPNFQSHNNDDNEDTIFILHGYLDRIVSLLYTEQQEKFQIAHFLMHGLKLSIICDDRCNISHKNKTCKQISNTFCHASQVDDHIHFVGNHLTFTCAFKNTTVV